MLPEKEKYSQQYKSVNFKSDRPCDLEQYIGDYNCFDNEPEEIAQYSHHIEEWRNSGIADDLIFANLRSLSGYSALNRLFKSVEITRINTGKVSNYFLKQYANCLKGGWYCRSVDMVRYGEMEWIQFKPDTPRTKREYSFGDMVEKEKTIKYESSPKMKARIILPFVPLERWIEISNKYNCPIDFDKYNNFWQWVIDHPRLPISITEGGKKALSLLSQNIIAIALPGVSMGIRKIDEVIKKLHPDLELFATEKRQFYILFDSDIKPKTVKAVSKAIFSLSVQLIKNKSKVNICHWKHELGKGIDDVLVSQDNKKEVLEQIYNESLDFNLWSCQYLFKLREADMRFCERWFSDGLKNIPNSRLVALKSFQNTGKTEIIVKKVVELVSSGECVFVLTHRESLARALAKRFGISYRTEKDELKEIIGYSLCIDSLLPKENGFNPEDWEDVTVVIDEVEQVLYHLFNGKTTVEEYRPTIFKTLVELAPKIKQMIIADADLSDISLDFCEGLMGCKAYLIVNEFKFSGMKFNRFSCPKRLLALIKQKILKGEKLFIVTSAQKSTSKYGTIALENFIRKLNPELRILIVDSETMGYPDSDSQGCLDRMSEIVTNYDVVICSPSIETGISVDVYGYFDSVIAFNTGNLSPHSFLQFMWRLRDIEIERYFYSAKRGNSYIGNKSQSPYKLLESTDKTSKTIFSNLGILDSEFDTQGISKLFLDTWAKIGARVNSASRCHQELLEKIIIEQGHILTDYEFDDEVSKDEIEFNTQECRDKRDNQTLSSKDLTPNEVEILEKKKSKTLDEICQLRKSKIKDRYGDISKEILEFDDDGLSPKLKLYYYTTLGYEFVKDRDKQVISKYLENNNNQLFAPDIINSTVAHKAEILRKLGILDLLDEMEREDFIYSNDDRILNLWEKSKPYSQQIKDILGVHCGKYPVAYFNSLIKCIGYSLGNRKQKRKDGEVYYEYPLIGLPEFAYHTCLHWYEKDVNLRNNNEDCDTTVVINFPYINNGEIDDLKFDDLKFDDLNFDDLNFEENKKKSPNIQGEVAVADDSQSREGVSESWLTSLVNRFKLDKTLENCKLRINQIIKLPNTKGQFRIIGFACGCVGVISSLITNGNVEREDLMWIDLRSIIPI